MAGPAIKTVRMVQTNVYRWQLEAEDGTVIKDDLLMHSPYEAERWANSYISSFQTWFLEMRPIKENEDAEP